MVNWKNICQLISAGGLGIRDLKLHNKAFMIKLRFRFVACEKMLWVRLLREKYKVDNSCPPSIYRQVCSFLWRSLNKVWNHVYDCICWYIGDGQRAKFWLDSWVPGIGPMIGHVVDWSLVDAGLLVADLVDDHDGWDWPKFKEELTLKL